MAGQDAQAYSDALAVDTLDPERSDIPSKIRRDFDAAGVVQSDEKMLRVLNELMLQAGAQMPSTRGGTTDALTAMLARKLQRKKSRPVRRRDAARQRTSGGYSINVRFAPKSGHCCARRVRRSNRIFRLKMAYCIPYRAVFSVLLEVNASDSCRFPMQTH
jgi:hypothetical protein